jgi:hypothetical protein
VVLYQEEKIGWETWIRTRIARSRNRQPTKKRLTLVRWKHGLNAHPEELTIFCISCLHLAPLGIRWIVWAKFGQSPSSSKGILRQDVLCCFRSLYAQFAKRVECVSPDRLILLTCPIAPRRGSYDNKICDLHSSRRALSSEHPEE